MPISPVSARIDVPLTQFATAYKNDEFFADILSPVVSTPDVGGKYAQRNRRDVSHARNDMLGSRGHHNEVDYDVTWTAYLVQDRGLKGVVSSQLRQSAAAVLSPDQLCVDNVMQNMMLNREIRVATQLCTSGNFTNTGAVGTVWTNETSGNPLGDIGTAVAAIPSFGANSKLVGYCAQTVWNALRKHPQMLALKGISEGQVSLEEAARYLGLDELYVSKTRKETANLGVTASYAYVYTATVFGIIALPRNAPAGNDVQAFSVTFRQEPGLEVRSWEIPDEGKGGSTAHAVELSDVEVIPQADMGYLLTSVIA